MMRSSSVEWRWLLDMARDLTMATICSASGKTIEAGYRLTCFPFGSSSSGDQICLKLEGDDAGSVWIWFRDEEVEPEGDEIPRDNCYFCANSLEEFLEGFYGSSDQATCEIKKANNTSSEVLINDAFYCMDTSLDVSRAISLLLKNGIPEYIPSELIFIPDILKLDAEQWESARDEARKTFFIRDSYAEGEEVDCPHLNARDLNVRMFSRTNIYCRRLDIAGDRPPRGVIPHGMCPPSFIVEQSFLDRLSERFTGFNAIKVDMNRLEAVNESTRAVLSSYSLYYCEFTPYVGDDLLVDHFKRSPLCCYRCGKPQLYCPYCDALSRGCPHCGLKRTLESDKSRQSLEDLFFITTATARRVWIDPRAELSIAKKFPILRGERWCGADLTSACFVVPVCTGRVVKWFVEENIGTVAFSPFHVDVSKCTPDQRERIESIRYTPEF
jgi:hypothetical protein